MSGETDLDELIRSMEPVLLPDTYAFTTFSGVLPPSIDAAIMTFMEAEGATAIVPVEWAVSHDVPYEFPCRMITLNIHSALDAVGFLARITTALAKHEMGVNPVSGFYHDHLFVPADRADDAMLVLKELSYL